jgi:hypothetical protein
MNPADSGSNICKKKTNKKNFFRLTLSNKVYVFNAQQLRFVIFFKLCNVLIFSVIL